ncbi:2OG-Fe(II) oxygenase [Paraburkholderia tagetis]|uniref:2OG-Fe(II) oxygenase n=1 Tax=Paraburkholderia tagetis TaxID=2913261 RepID=A0A9X1UKP2_9BURK|nr:2OG-Fe(II) oxygenase [Paraburkholderia tagetis]MCG5075161.1 2OG-Fe(II) oxygenase [Paraburkholderia tagetis]
MNAHAMIERFDLDVVSAQLGAEGYAVLPGCFSPHEARALARLLDEPLDEPRDAPLDAPHVPVSSAWADTGSGQPCYFGEDLPPLLHAWREALYRWLVPVANRWHALAGLEPRFPAELDAFLDANRRAGQHRPQSHLSRLREGDRLALHRHDEGEHVFPFQVVALLCAPQRDFTGGEFVMVEQRPRMQSRPMVVPLALGDAAIVATAQRPVEGTHGYYRVKLKHAISRVRGGERTGLELLFHDAP